MFGLIGNGVLVYSFFLQVPSHFSHIQFHPLVRLPQSHDTTGTTRVKANTSFLQAMWSQLPHLFNLLVKQCHWTAEQAWRRTLVSVLRQSYHSYSPAHILRAQFSPFSQTVSPHTTTICWRHGPNWKNDGYNTQCNALCCILGWLAADWSEYRFLQKWPVSIDTS